MKFKFFLVTMALLLITVAGSCVPPATDILADPIEIDTGLVSGVTIGEKRDVRVYKGIPFAAPPVGNLRWKPPQPAPPWQGVRKCTEFGPDPHGYVTPIFRSVATRTSEDCLYINVWTPAKSRSDRLPVMVWIYGGGFRFGSGAVPLYDGENLARRGVIVVTFNYRVGPFGFMAHPLLSKESEHNSSGNYGLLDQIAALQWVQRNIAAFGGDPNRVTIFGESAGAISVICLMVSPLSKGLFHRAISQSFADLGFFTHLRENRYGNEPKERMGEKLARDLGCADVPDPIACMRAKSAEEVMAKGRPPVDYVSPGYRYGPVVDGWAITDHPINIFEAGKQHRVPFMLGSTADEWALFQLVMPPVTVESYKEYVNKTFGDKARQVLAMYSATSNDEAKACAEQVLTLYAFTCPTKAYATAMSRVKEVYLYEFTRVPPGAGAMGAYHALEIGYVFGNLIPILPTPDPEAYFNDTDKALSEAMMGYWTQFAATGNPNQKGLPEWPAYDIKSGRYLDLGDSVRVKSGLYPEACVLFNEIARDKRGR